MISTRTWTYSLFSAELLSSRCARTRFTERVSAGKARIATQVSSQRASAPSNRMLPWPENQVITIMHSPPIGPSQRSTRHHSRKKNTKIQQQPSNKRICAPQTKSSIAATTLPPWRRRRRRSNPSETSIAFPSARSKRAGIRQSPRARAIKR